MGFQEARYVIEQRALTASGAMAGTGNSDHKSSPPNRTQETSQEGGPECESEVTAPAKQAAVAIFQSHKSASGEGHYVDYSSPQPVFLAPLAGFTHSGAPPRHRSQSPTVDERRPLPRQWYPSIW